ncbi:hypothetical protein EDC04DRAFT_2745959 [Pisolithus marmoratus]|nr:hypothetical protein EDC04DRAFT_2745959 [Pisolithus marmoratus]
MFHFMPPNAGHACWTSFIAIKTGGDLFADASKLHPDLFHLTQPRSRLEDLVRHYGMCEGVIHITSSGVIGSSSTASLDSVASGSSRSMS